MQRPFTPRRPDYESSKLAVVFFGLISTLLVLLPLPLFHRAMHQTYVVVSLQLTGSTSSKSEPCQSKMRQSIDNDEEDELERVMRLLASKGYAVVKIPVELRAVIMDLFALEKQFFQRPREMRNQPLFKPLVSDQGYTKAPQLKERMRVRFYKEEDCEGRPIDKESFEVDFKEKCFAAFAAMNNFLQDLIISLAQQRGIPNESILSVLDWPLNTLPTGGVTSSILDLFHYYNHSEHEMNDGSELALKHNIGPHTDNSILTMVPMAEVSGLQIWDVEELRWVDMEDQTFEASWEEKLHGSYAVVFTGDSIEALTDKLFSSTLHRVVRTSTKSFTP